MPKRLRLATYNVHRCIGSDGRHDPERIASVIRELDADVVALQEVTRRAGRPGDQDQLAVIAAATGLRSVAGPTLLLERGHQGNAILTGLAISEVRRADLSHPGREPRGALDVDLRADRTRLRVVATHLGLRRSERRAQLARLNDLCAAEDAPPTVVLGDLNEWWRPARAAALLSGRSRTRTPPTFPARFPVFALDRIVVRPPNRLLSLSTHDTADARVASDHLPLCAEIELVD